MFNSCDPTDCSPPGSSVHGDSPGKNTGVGCHFLLQGKSLIQHHNSKEPVLWGSAFFTVQLSYPYVKVKSLSPVQLFATHGQSNHPFWSQLAFSLLPFHHLFCGLEASQPRLNMNVVFQDAFLGKGPGANMHFCVGFLGSPLNWCPSALKRLEAIILFKNRAQMCNKAYTECVYPLVHFLITKPPHVHYWKFRIRY